MGITVALFGLLLSAGRRIEGDKEMKKKEFVFGFFVILVFGYVNPATAAPPNVLGSYSGSISETDSMCSDPADNGTFSGTLALTIDQQDAGSYSGSGQSSFGDGISFSGNVVDNGGTSGNFNADDGSVTSSGTYIGTFSGDQFQFSFSGTASDGCMISGSAILTKGAGQAAQQIATVAVTSLATVINATSSLNAHLNTLHDGENAGVNLNGLNINVDGNTFSLTEIQKWLGSGQGGAAGGDSSILGDKLGVFVNGNFSFGDHDRTSREAGFDFDIFGVTVGTDYRLTDQLFLGMAFGYAATDSDFDRSGGGSEVDTYSISLYSSYNHPGNFYLDGLLRFGWSDYELDRTFSIAGARQKAEADYDGIDYAVSISGGYDFVFGRFSIQPIARFEYVAVDIDEYREKARSAGAATSLLAVNQQNLQSLRTSLGGQATYVISTSQGIFVPTLRIEWQHEYKNNSRTIRSSLISTPTFQFSSQSDKPDRNFLNLGAGVTAVFAQGVSGFLNYEALLGNQYLSQHTVNLGMRIEF